MSRGDTGDCDAKGMLGVGFEEAIVGDIDRIFVAMAGLALETSLRDEVIDGDTSIGEDGLGDVDDVTRGDETVGEEEVIAGGDSCTVLDAISREVNNGV
ncbi:hypothetical protein KI387_020744, partial [Taxus chinensis]